jgi:hypothetical protein
MVKEGHLKKESRPKEIKGLRIEDPRQKEYLRINNYLRIRYRDYVCMLLYFT